MPHSRYLLYLSPLKRTGSFRGVFSFIGPTKLFPERAFFSFTRIGYRHFFSSSLLSRVYSISISLLANIQRSSERKFRNFLEKSLGTFWKISRNFLGKLSELFGKTLGTFWKNSRNFLEKSLGTFARKFGSSFVSS